jgi:predicted transcriptional regulator
VSQSNGADVLDLLGDGYVQQILSAADGEPKSVGELSDACDVVESTVYRRVDDLVEAGLLDERTRIADDGSHHSVYISRFEEISVRLADGVLEAEVTERSDAAGRFTTMWEGIRST